ncbi:MAG: cytochrome c peroxidase [Bryobacterales bacterium]
MLGLDAYMPVPAENPLTPEKAALGKRLFEDPVLSADRTVSCASCHDAHYGYADDQPVAVGVREQKGTRRSPRLINRGYGRVFFWDGRAGSLEEQALKPIENPIEMDLALAEAIERLRAEPAYVAEFAKAFDGAAPDAETLSRALASYVRTIVSGASPYDRYLAGDQDALDAAQKRGLEVFRGKGGCTLCHMGPNLTDEQFHNTGVGWSDGKTADEGRYAVTGNARDRGAFKTPTLRESARSGPYMHDGSLETLADVIDFYDDGGKKNPQLDRDMQPLELTDQEKKDLERFLHALNGEIREGL